jgi:hypothetical protein
VAVVCVLTAAVERVAAQQALAECHSVVVRWSQMRLH